MSDMIGARDKAIGLKVFDDLDRVDAARMVNMP
jgi:hypothetical protein